MRWLPSFACASALAATLAVFGVVFPADADTIGITALADIGANDEIDWGQLGPNQTLVPNPAAVLSANGLPIGVSMPGDVSFANSGNFDRFDQSSVFFNGNFAVGDELLWTYYNRGPLTLTFSSRNQRGRSPNSAKYLR